MRNIPISRLEKMCLTYIVTWAVSPPIQYGNIYRVLCVICFLIVEIKHLNTISNHIKKEQAVKFIFILTLIFLTLIFDGVDGVSVRFQLCICIMLMSLYDIYRNKIVNIQFIIWYMLILLVIWNLCTLNAYSTQRNVSRLLAKDFNGAEIYAKRGIEGYGNVYSLMFMLPVSIRLLLKEIRNLAMLKKIILSAFIVTTVAVILSAGYFIANIITIIGFAGVFICNFKEKNRNIIMILVIAIAVILIINADKVLNQLAIVTKGTMYERKIADLIQSMASDEVTGTVYGRWERYSRSIKLFLYSPIWGQLTRASVGKHSQILDLFAQFGAFFGLWFCMLFIRFFKNIKRECSETFLCSLVEIMLFMFMLLNNVAYTFGIVLGIFLPIALHIMEDSHE